MYRSFAFATALMAGLARGQQVGTLQTETHPSMTWEKCTAAGSTTRRVVPPPTATPETLGTQPSAPTTLPAPLIVRSRELTTPPHMELLPAETP
jgi:hypothetical protein